MAEQGAAESLMVRIRLGFGISLRGLLMLQRTRRFTPAPTAGDSANMEADIQDIVSEAVTVTKMNALWPSHPVNNGLPDGMKSVHFGTTGVV